VCHRIAVRRVARRASARPGGTARDTADFRVGPNRERRAGRPYQRNAAYHRPTHRKTEAFTASLVFNAYLVTSMPDLDDTFGQWLAEARAVGDGAHLSREAPGRSG
jgi:hypothetical protein